MTSYFADNDTILKNTRWYHLLNINCIILTKIKHLMNTEWYPAVQRSNKSMRCFPSFFYFEKLRWKSNLTCILQCQIIVQRIHWSVLKLSSGNNQGTHGQAGGQTYDGNRRYHILPWHYVWQGIKDILLHQYFNYLLCKNIVIKINKTMC